PLLLEEMKKQHVTPTILYTARQASLGDNLAQAIATMDDVPLGELQNAYFDAKPDSRAGFADLIGKRGKAALPLLIAILRERRPRKDGERGEGIHLARQVALAYVRRLGPQARAAVPTLIGALREHRDVQRETLQALAAIGPGAKDAVDPILNCART